MNKILVTGGAGYIGSHTVVELVKAGYEPIILDNFCNSEHFIIDRLKQILERDIICYEGDCRDEKFLAKVYEAEQKIDGVVHFAAIKAVGESVLIPLDYYDNNVCSLISLLKTVKAKGTPHFVFSSSACVYGQPDVLPATEETPIRQPESPYGNNKKICEEIISDLVKSGANIKAISLRYFNPMGAHRSGLIGELPKGVPNNLVPFVTQTAAGIREKLTVYGNDYNTPDKTCLRDYLHVVDLARAHVCALQYLEKIDKPNHYDIFNLGTGKATSVMEIINTFEKVNGVKLNYTIGGRRQGDVESLYANADKAARLLNWRTELTLEDALRDAWNWQLTLSK
jgi:UDP-glucose 4-epimerase